MRHYIDIVRHLYEADTPPHGVDGLPGDVRFSDRTLHNLIARGAYRAVATPGKKEGEYRIHLHPNNPGPAVAYHPRPAKHREGRGAAAYYDPEVADIEVVDPEDEYLEFHIPRAKQGFETEFKGLPGENVIYRGMSAEEYESFLRTGEIKSLGDYNIGDDQRGLTYWTTDPTAAQSYANSFAPAQFKPTFGHPSYIVAAHPPDPSDVRRVRGTGAHEVGVTRAIGQDEVVAIWRGRVFDFETDPFELSPVTDWDHIDRAVRDGDTHRVRNSGHPRAQVVWERIQ